MLEAIRSLDPEANNITRFVERYRFNSLHVGLRGSGQEPLGPDEVLMSLRHRVLMKFSL